MWSITQHLAKSTPVIGAAVITSMVAIIGWVVVAYLARKREDRTKRLELIIEYKRKQIGEFYGALYTLIELIFNISQIKKNITDSQAITAENKRNIENYFREKYFLPLHNEIRDIIKSKSYLIEGGMLPSSFLQYLEHSIQETVQINVYKDLQIDLTSVPGVKFKIQFYYNVKDQLNVLKYEYDLLLESLK